MSNKDNLIRLARKLLDLYPEDSLNDQLPSLIRLGIWNPYENTDQAIEVAMQMGFELHLKAGNIIDNTGMWTGSFNQGDLGDLRTAIVSAAIR